MKTLYNIFVTYLIISLYLTIGGLMFKLHKLAMFIAVGALVIMVKPTTAEAALVPSNILTITLDNFYDIPDETGEAGNESIEEKIINTRGFAQVSGYVFIKSDASDDAANVGKLYDNAVATILSKKNDWFKIKSGSITGYVKAGYMVTGEKAEAIAKKVGKKTAVVNVSSLKIRSKATTTSSVLGNVRKGNQLTVVDDTKGWVKIKTKNNTYGFISKKYIKINITYATAVSVLDTAKNNQSQNENNSNTSNTTSSSSNSVITSTGSKIAVYAAKFVGNRYVWGGTSLTRGTDCSGFTQSLYKSFGISIPRTSRAQATGGTRVSINNLKQGDLLFYSKRGTINHVGVYIGNGKVISASSPSTGIRITAYNYRKPVKAVRYY